MARAIDASELIVEIQVCSWDSEQDKERAEDIVLGMPTLTTPNKWVSVEERLPARGQLRYQGLRPDPGGSRAAGGEKLNE